MTRTKFTKFVTIVAIQTIIYAKISPKIPFSTFASLMEFNKNMKNRRNLHMPAEFSLKSDFLILEKPYSIHYIVFKSIQNSQ